MASLVTRVSGLYQPLNTLGSIRLLRLHFDKNTQFITGHLRSVNLNSPNCPPFITLSYTWQDTMHSSDNHHQGIKLDGHDHSVLPSLYPILHGICHSSKLDANAWYWIDAICINQDDNDERARQVQLMRRLYSRSVYTIVWLGPGTSQTDKAIEFFIRLSRRCDWFLARSKTSPGDRSIPPDLANSEDWDALNALLLRPWWRRVWTLQELLLSVRVRFHCGGEKVFTDIDLNRGLYSHYACNHGIAMGVETHVWHAAWGRRRIKQWFDIQPDGMRLVALMAYTSDYGVTDPRDRVFGMLGLASEEDVFMVGPPSYAEELTVEVLSTRLAESFIRQRSSLDIVCLAEFFCSLPNSLRPTMTSLPPLPSWVPDWRVQRSTFVMPLMVSQSAGTHIGNFRPMKARQLVAHAASYRASGDRPPIFSISKDRLRLSCVGVVLDHIDGLGEALGEPNDSDGHTSLVQSTSQAHLGHSVPDQTSSQPWQKEAGTLLDEVVRCMVLNRQDRYLSVPAPVSRYKTELLYLAGLSAAEKKETEVIPRSVYRWFFGWLHANKSLRIRGTSLADLVHPARPPETPKSQEPVRQDPPVSLSGSLEEELASRLRDTTEPVGMRKRIFTTEKWGHVGMGPMRARKGDFVCILLGCSVPVALRLTATCDGQDQAERFEFIGECYVDGFMNGEIFQQPYGTSRKYREFVLV